MIYKTELTNANGHRNAAPKRWSEKQHRHRAMMLGGTIRKTWWRLPGLVRKQLEKELVQRQVRLRLGGTKPPEIEVTWEQVRTSTVKALIRDMIHVGLNPATGFEVRMTVWKPELCFLIGPRDPNY